MIAMAIVFGLGVLVTPLKAEVIEPDWDKAEVMKPSEVLDSLKRWPAMLKRSFKIVFGDGIHPSKIQSPTKTIKQQIDSIKTIIGFLEVRYNNICEKAKKENPHAYKDSCGIHAKQQKAKETEKKLKEKVKELKENLETKKSPKTISDNSKDIKS
jgi:hypothetical protein